MTRRTFGSVCLTLGAWLIVIASCDATAAPLDDRCLSLIRELSQDQSRNRQAVKTFRSHGTIMVWQGAAREEPRLRSDAEFDYWEAGTSRRSDVHYRRSLTHDGKDEVRNGRTEQRAGNERWTITNLTGADVATVLPGNAFRFNSDLAYLSTLGVSRSYETHLEELQFRLDRGWNNEKETMTVAKVGETQWAVEYRSLLGGLCIDRRVFDRAKGSEVVSASEHDENSKGELVDDINASYQVTEVMPGAWRVTGCEMTSGSATSSSKRQIKTTWFKANGADVPSETFTFAGLGVKPGANVADRRTDPIRQFTFSKATIREADLDKALAVTDAFEGGVQDQVADPILKRPSFLVILCALFTIALAVAAWMRLRVRLRVLGLAAAALGALSAQSAFAESPFLADRELNLFHGYENACGVVAVYHAMRHLGKSVSLEEIGQTATIDDSGSSFSDLARCLASHGIERELIYSNRLRPLLDSTSWHQRCLLLLMDRGTHYVLIVRSRSGERVLLDGRTAETVNESQLSARYSGGAMLIGAGAKRAATTRAMIRPSICGAGATLLGALVGYLAASRWVAARPIV